MVILNKLASHAISHLLEISRRGLPPHVSAMESGSISSKSSSSMEMSRLKRDIDDRDVETARELDIVFVDPQWKR